MKYIGYCEIDNYVIESPACDNYNEAMDYAIAIAIESGHEEEIGNCYYTEIE